MSPSRPRGRPRLFDKDEALTTIQRIFWKNGYSATSLDQISAETKINRPSLYATFGSKKDIYIKCLEHFAEMMGKRTEAAILSETEISRGLEKVFMQAMEIYRPKAKSDGGPMGCFVTCTAPSEAGADEEIKEVLKMVLDRIDQTMCETVEAAIKDRKIQPKQTVEITGHLLGCLLNGLSLRARSGTSRDELERTAKAGIEQILA
ncbi:MULTISPECIES: TetR/AcrR family transcriptional regulator [unclassified Pseudovibrio]|uniref:TetR/AcrR family transcriptional regulator n=1 Tax=unclassified Pseudovibrio TaxID=2627060 RepID=UPI0007B30C1E|nr:MULTISPECIES: TetR/AcrR family transcriptional regulator [unclassified Pseudovibrio]KZL02840.1 HTH-type transcriptional repressor ComR [Pseudovibrio sp. W74]KZL07543.1 HTH-type transcriptional repressor ComR [Pseudovibrio sp. Ad14]